MRIPRILFNCSLMSSKIVTSIKNLMLPSVQLYSIYKEIHLYYPWLYLNLCLIIKIVLWHKKTLKKSSLSRANQVILILSVHLPHLFLMLSLQCSWSIRRNEPNNHSYYFNVYFVNCLSHKKKLKIRFYFFLHHKHNYYVFGKIHIAAVNSKEKLLCMQFLNANHTSSLS